jgi:hypothetical protein
MPSVSKNFVPVSTEAVAVSELVFPFVNAGLELKSDIRFLGFDEKKRANDAKEGCGKLAGNSPLVQRFVSRIRASFAFMKTPSEVLFHVKERGTVCHTDASANLHDGSFFVNGNPNGSFAIKQPGSVSDQFSFQSILRKVIDGMMANSVELQCPARKGAEGQYRTKHGESQGVRREQVPSPEGKICSELGRNAERLTEMFSPSYGYTHSVSVPKKVTDCNTNYIEVVAHQDADLEILERRQPTNQDGEVVPILWMGNMTCSNRKQQAVIIA